MCAFSAADAASLASQVFKEHMGAHLRSVPDGTAGEARVVDLAPSFEEFYDANFRRLYTALGLVTGNRHEAEEIAQDAFVRVFERWDRVGLVVRADGSGSPEEIPELVVKGW
jgi:hypothetical protein